MKCSVCGKRINQSYRGGGLESSTECYCKDCADKLESEDLELLESIKRGENVYGFIEPIDL